MALQIACPAASNEVAEAFVVRTLSPDRATFFGRHIAYCSKCAEEVENTRAFVLAMCDALRTIELRHSNAGMNGYEVNRALLGDCNLGSLNRVAVTWWAMVGDRVKILARRIRWLYRQADHTEDFVPLEKYLNGALLPVLALAGGEMAAQIVEFPTEIPDSSAGGLSV